MERTMGKSYISQGERIERLNAVRHEIAQHFNEGFAWIDQILSEEIEQISLEKRCCKDTTITGHWIHEQFKCDKSVTGYFMTPRCECSICGYFSNYECNPCPSCGALMILGGAGK